MRKFALLAIVGVVALAAFASIASARIDHHFTVVTRNISGHQTSDGGFAFHQALFSTFNRSNQVGNDRVRCRPTAQRKLKCKGYIHLNGEVGGAGFLRINGNFGHGDKRLNITAGTGQFAGAAGKLVVHGHFLHISLVR